MSPQTLENILARLPAATIGVLGDLFLDRYLDIDATLTEPSIETNLDAYQVVAVRASPGAAGTVINNLSALGVGDIRPITVIGDDGEGYELRGALSKLPAVKSAAVFSCPNRRTPTYTKPMLCEPNRSPRELNRLDIKNRSVLSAEYEAKIMTALDELWPRLDALLVVDQVSEPDCGVITASVRHKLAELGERTPDKVILADSRRRISRFRSVWLKPNQAECLEAVGGSRDIESAVRELARQAGRPVYCTCSENGILLADPRPKSAQVVQIPAYKVTGPIDPVGAGDSTSAALACALAAGASLRDAAEMGNLVASITIQQLGTTGTATPQQVRERNI